MARTDLVAIILAAGQARRFGKPKQLHCIDGDTLLSRCLKNVSTVGVDSLVILGAHYKQVAPTLPAQTNIIFNPDWDSGMASSLLTAIKSLPASAKAMLVVLPDQLKITANDLNQLVKEWQQNPQKIVCARYSDTVGVPAILPRRVFGELKKLRGDHGARQVITTDDNIIAVNLPNGTFDLDTLEDLSLFSSGSPHD